MKIIGSILNYLFAVLLLVFGFIYLTRNSFMPYHGDAVLLSWNEVDQNIQHLILALMRAVSGGFIVSGIAIVFLQIKFTTDRSSWIPLLILIIGLLIESTTIYATQLVKINTPGDPPTYLAYLAIAILIIGYFLNVKSINKK